MTSNRKPAILLIIIGVAIFLGNLYLSGSGNMALVEKYKWTQWIGAGAAAIGAFILIGNKSKV